MSQTFIDDEAFGEGTGHVRPSVLLEFGARSTGEPDERRTVDCDAAQHIAGCGLSFGRTQFMRPERPFREKATAIHVFCAQGSFRGPRDQAAQRRVQRRQIAADPAHVPHLATSSLICGGDADAVLVDIQTAMVLFPTFPTPQTKTAPEGAVCR